MYKLQQLTGILFGMRWLRGVPVRIHGIRGGEQLQQNGPVLSTGYRWRSLLPQLTTANYEALHSKEVMKNLTHDSTQ